MKETRDKKRKKDAIERPKKKKPSDEVAAVQKRYRDLTQAECSTFAKFSQFPLSQQTLEGLEASGFTEPTAIQRDSLYASLSGEDVVAAAKTGSGKTLALVVPLLECLWRARWTRHDRLGALVLSPTRELALQIFNVIRAVGRFHDYSCALLIGGGTDVEFERQRVGLMNVVVATPGRLLQHLDESADFYVDSLQMLVLDEADRCLDMGFQKQLNSIVAALPKDRQTLLFSATQTTKVADLTRLALRSAPVFVSVHANSEHCTPDELKQFYMVVDEHDKPNTLFSFVAAHNSQKTLAFFASCKQTRFFAEALCYVRPAGVEILGLWGTMAQNKRIDVYEKFERPPPARKPIGGGGGLCCLATDVASRGLDFNGVDWVLQVDCPLSAEDYIHRVGRTARNGKPGNALLILTPAQEKTFVPKLVAKNIPIRKIKQDPHRQKNIAARLSACLAEHPHLKEFAQGALVAYVKSLCAQTGGVEQAREIEENRIAAAYGLAVAPRFRFLRKKGQQKAKKNEKEEEMDGAWKLSQEKKEGGEEEDEEEEEEDLLTISRKDVFQMSGKERAEEPEKPALSKKVLTKEAVARKLLKHSTRLNKRIVFGEGDDEENGEGAQVLDDDLAGAGLDMETAKKEMVDAVKTTKAEHRARLRQIRREKRLKAKLNKKRKNEKDEAAEFEDDGEDESDEGPDLSWLPDPDNPKGYDEDSAPEEEEEEERPRKRQKGTRKEEDLEARALRALLLGGAK